MKIIWSIVAFLGFLMVIWWGNEQRMAWYDYVSLSKKVIIQDQWLDSNSWQQVVDDYQNYGWGAKLVAQPIKNSAQDMVLLTKSWRELSASTKKIDWREGVVPAEIIQTWFTQAQNICSSGESLANRVRFWQWLGFADIDNQQIILGNLIRPEWWQDCRTILRALSQWTEQSERIVFLLQNNNEPRSSGGFAGSVLVLDLTPDGWLWQIVDTYAWDRLVPEEAHRKAPEFFHDLAPSISLRDAGMWPDFRDTARYYRQWLKAANLPEPQLLATINLSILSEIMQFLPPLTLDQWGLELNASNAELVLQFLVESKIAGRFATKGPVMSVLLAIIEKWPQNNNNEITNWWLLLQKIQQEKLLLGHSLNADVQQLLQKYKLTGALLPEVGIDNFLHFDFVSVGANKSEYFTWTKINHDLVLDGELSRATNTIKIKRTHALRPGELTDLLESNDWWPNILNLLTPDLRWKLGEGQNRTVIRITVPMGAKLQKSFSPSGKIKTTAGLIPGSQVWEIPLFVSPGESIEVEIVYDTDFSSAQNNYRWQLLGTPARRQTSFLSTVTALGRKFVEVEGEVGSRQSLVDTIWRIAW